MLAARSIERCWRLSRAELIEPVVLMTEMVALVVRLLKVGLPQVT